MATVYLAHDLKHDRDVAIKVLREDVASTVGADRFLREIHLAAKLNHPNVIALFDSGDIHGGLFYVMPAVNGQSLRELLNSVVHVLADVGSTPGAPEIRRAQTSGWFVIGRVHHHS